MEKIADIIISKCAQHGNTLVLVNSIPFGEKLARLIKGAVFLYGASPKDLRKEHYEMFDQHDDLIVIASSGIASTGISIDRVFSLVLVDAGKSFIRAIQSIGRGLRLADDKTHLQATDIYSKLKWSKKHFKSRKQFYDEAGYPVEKKISVKVKN
jgi:superfamily II DNA or RNA helicase